MISVEQMTVVRSFVRDHIESFEQLQVLLALRHAPQVRWSAEMLAQQTRVAPALVADALRDLQCGGLVQALETPTESSYGYEAADTQLTVAVDALVRAYEENPLEIIRFMSANAIERVRSAAIHTFADAFLLRRDRK